MSWKSFVFSDHLPQNLGMVGDEAGPVTIEGIRLAPADGMKEFGIEDRRQGFIPYIINGEMDKDARLDIPPGAYVQVAVDGNASSNHRTIVEKVGQENSRFLPQLP